MKPSRSNHFKGQSMAFEQFLLFTMGVAIFIASFAVFTMYQGQYMQSASDDQLSGVKEYVLMNIANVASMEDFNTSVYLRIPRMLSNNPYMIELSDSGINVSMANGQYSYSGLAPLNSTYKFSGEVRSVVEEVVIYKTGDEIIIR
jgi:hypothetical protein